MVDLDIVERRIGMESFPRTCTAWQLDAELQQRWTSVLRIIKVIE
tara:strand:+ start:2585 stop:2719 length:135 start_codon:yes stop_codon:yes gene_type:complete